MSVQTLSRALALVFCLSLAGLSFAEAPVIHSGGTAEQGLVQADLTEQWRLGGEDDEVFFGTVGAVRTDAAGHLYLLDGQLSQIHVFAPDGEYLSTVGREGDGPGEVRRPNDLFITPDGTLNILQGFPGKIVKLTPDGLPAGEANYAASAGSAGQFGVLVAGRSGGDDIVLAGIQMTMAGAISEQTYFLARCNRDGQQQAALLEKTHTINYADFRLDEGEMDFVWGRLAVGSDGRVFAAPQRDQYAIKVFGTDGTHQMTISRDFTAPPRTEAQSKLARQVIEAVGANYPVPPVAITIEDTEPVVGNLHLTADGRLWTQSSRSDMDLPDGTWVILDVFAPDGRFEKQVALRGDHDPARDAINVLPDGRIIVTVGALDAFLNQQGAGTDEDSGVEADPLSVICYKLK